MSAQEQRDWAEDWSGHVATAEASDNPTAR